MNRIHGRAVSRAGIAVVLMGTVIAGSYSVRAEVPTDPPIFTDPLSITAAYHPFVVGRIKTFVIQQGHTDAEVVDTYLAETRAFDWGGGPVETRVLREMEIEDGEIVEISQNYFAQADNGSVYYFGEVVDIYENGVIIGHDGSWLVGGPTLPTDPEETATAEDPTIFMPANPEVGDIFKPEDLFPYVDETDEVIKVGKTVRVPAGLLTDCIRILETTLLSDDTETKWYAPDVGVIKTKSKGEILVLVEIDDP